MESSKFLFKIYPDVLKVTSEWEPVYFTKPRLVDYYEKNSDTLKPASKVHYFKKPKQNKYPIDLNVPNNSHNIESSVKADLECELKYAMSSKFEKSVHNVEKIKVFITRDTLVKLMCCYYRKEKVQYKIRVCRYNGDLYMAFGNNDNHSTLELNKFKQQAVHLHQFEQNVFTESLYYDVNINEPSESNYVLIGVHQSSLGEFELIYSGRVHGIQAEDEIIDCDDMEVLNACHWVMADTMWECEKDDPQRFLSLWLEAYLAHALDIYIALYSLDFKVHLPIDHKRLPQLPNENKSHWKPNICTAFLHKFLKEVNKLMSNDNINSFSTVYEFFIDTDDRTSAYKIFEDKPDMHVVTPEYMEYCKKNTSN